MQTQTKSPIFRWYVENKKITSQTQRKIPIYGCDKEERIISETHRKIRINGYRQRQSHIY